MSRIIVGEYYVTVVELRGVRCAHNDTKDRWFINLDGKGYRWDGPYKDESQTRRFVKFFTAVEELTG